MKPSSPSIDPESVLASFGFPQSTIVGPVTGGRDTAIWKVIVEGREAALRIFRPEQASILPREVQAMVEARRIGLPVPDVLATGSWQGRPVMLVEWARGLPMFMRLQNDPTSVRKLGQAMGNTLAHLHRVTSRPRTALTDWGIQDESLAKRLDGLTDRESLLHLDYHPLNLLVTDWEISAVLDWTMCAYGDPRADIARCIYIHRISPFVRELGYETRILARKVAKEFVRGYTSSMGELEELAPFLIWAVLRGIEEVRYHAEVNGFPANERTYGRLEKWVFRLRNQKSVS